MSILDKYTRTTHKNASKLKRGDFFSSNTKMKKDLGVSAAMSIVVGCVIGAGVFFKPYAIYGATGGAPGMGMLAWIFGGIASLLGALPFAEVDVMIPKTGGMVAYLGDTFGEKVGFLAGWMQTIMSIGSIAITLVGLPVYLAVKKNKK